MKIAIKEEDPLTNIPITTLLRIHLINRRIMAINTSKIVNFQMRTPIKVIKTTHKIHSNTQTIIIFQLSLNQIRICNNNSILCLGCIKFPNKQDITISSKYIICLRFITKLMKINK